MESASPAEPAPSSAADLERWYRRFRETAEALATRLLGDAEEARDAVQQAFLRAWRAEAPPRDREEPWSWLARIVANACRDRLRARRVRERALPLAHELRAEHDLEVPGAELERRARIERIAQALAELPTPLREIVELKHYAGLRFAEVATALDLPIPTVKSRMARALDLLRAKLRSLE